MKFHGTTTLRRASIVLAMFLLRCRGPSSTDWVNAFVEARCVHPNAEDGNSTWNQTAATSRGSFVVSGRGGVGGEIELRFKGENIVRRVTTYTDYEYPSDVRISESQAVLWVATVGSAGGLRPIAHLYRYNLDAKSVEVAEIASASLPASCPAQLPSTPTTQP